MGMPLYGQSFRLEKESENGLNAKAPGGGEAGEFTRADGFLAYYEICDNIKNKGWTVVHDPYKTMGPYAYKGENALDMYMFLQFNVTQSLSMMISQVTNGYLLTTKI